MATNKEILAGKRLQLIPAVSAFYALQAIGGSPKFVQGDLFLQSSALFIEDFTAYKKEFERKLARVLFDYLALAAFGEARHAEPDTIEDTVFARPQSCKILSRNTAYDRATTHDPKKFLPYIVSLFRNRDAFCGGCVGGDSWARIAESALLYFTMPAPVFIDHVVDLSHNGGICFDKPVLVALSDSDIYWDILNKKAREDYTYGPLDDKTAAIVNRAVQLGFIKCFDSYSVYSVCELNWPEPIKWGKKSILVQRKKVKDVKTQAA